MQVRRSFRVAGALVTVLLASPAAAQQKMFGSWTVGVLDDAAGLYAGTINESGGLLGKYCFRNGEKCLWLMANDVNCEDGSRYSALVNADTGAGTVTIRCVKIEGKPRYLFEEFDVIDSAVRGASWFGVAFPLKSGRFQVSRFAMNGAADAIAFMRRAAEAMVAPASQSQGTKDESF